MDNNTTLSLDLLWKPLNNGKSADILEAREVQFLSVRCSSEDDVLKVNL